MRRFADGKYIRWVLGSSAIVRAPRSVFKVWITVNFPGATSLAIVVVPSPQEANASRLSSRALNFNENMYVMGGGRVAPNPSNEVDVCC